MARIKLSTDDIAALQQHQRNLSDLQQELDDAEECGIDCRHIRAASEMLSNQITNLVTKYAPPPEP